MSRLVPLAAATVIFLVIAAGALVYRNSLSEDGASQLKQPQFSGMSPEEQDAALARSAQASRDLIQAFVDTGGDPCSLPAVELAAFPVLPYSRLAALVNDSELIVVADPVVWEVQSPEEQAISGTVLVEFQVASVIKGTPPEETFTATLGMGVARAESDSLSRSVFGFDACSDGPMLLFPRPTGDPGVSWIPHQGWAILAGGEVEAREANSLFDQYGSSAALLAAVSGVVTNQENEDLVRGQLVCEDARTSPGWVPPAVCPGEPFNPYTTYRLDMVRAATVMTRTGAGPAGSLDISADPGLPDVLQALDIGTLAESPRGVGRTFHAADDVELTVVLSEALKDDDLSITFWYSPSGGTIRLPSFFSGEIPAPPAFEQAMLVYLVAP